MAYQTVSYFEVPPIEGSNTPDFISSTLNAINEKYATVFQALRSETITHVGFRTGNITTGGTVDVRLETYDSSTGAYTGSLVAAGANASQVIGNADDNIYFEVALGTPPSVTEGTFYCIVIVVPTGFNGAFTSFADTSNVGTPFGLAELTVGTISTLGGGPIATVK